MATGIIGKKNSVCFKYSGSHSSMKESIKEEMHKMEVEERRRLYALLVCIVTVVFDLFLGAAAFVCAAVTDSSAGYAFALDCLLDVIAASFLIWRFYGSSSIHSEFKESIACVCLGVLFCLAACGIVTKSVYDLVCHTVPQQLVFIFVLAGVGGATNTCLGIVKYFLGRKMKSQSLVLEAINTCLSGLLAFMLAVSDILYFYHPSFWTIDPITSLFVAMVLFVGGIKVLCSKKKSESPELTPLLASTSV